MTDEVLKLALDALEGFIPYLPLKDEAQCNSYDKAITALRLVIDAQNMASKSTYKEQLETKDEPVALVAEVHISRYTIEWTNGPLPQGTKLYTTPQRTCVRLSKEEINEGLLRSFYVLEKARAWRDGVAWAIQQLKDKNNV